MKNFSLGPDEALLFEGSADRKKSNDKHTRQTNIYLTNLNMIFEFVPPKIFGRGEVEIESFPVSDIKIYNGEPQIKNNGGEVKVFFTDLGCTFKVIYNLEVLFNYAVDGSNFFNHFLNCNRRAVQFDPTGI